MGRPTFTDAVMELAPKTNIHHSATEIIEWDISEEPTGITQPTQSEIDTKLLSMQSEYDNDYARKRKAEYPSIGDQLDMMYKDTKNSTTTHADAVEAVKTKWPKDNSGPVE